MVTTIRDDDIWLKNASTILDAPNSSQNAYKMIFNTWNYLRVPKVQPNEEVNVAIYRQTLGRA